MNAMNFFQKTSITIALTIAALFLSCDTFEDTSDYKINLFLICTGGTTSSHLFSATVILDDDTPIALSELSGSMVIPAGKIKTATITLTRADSSDSLMILAYKDNKLDEKGYSILPTCTTSSTTTYCSNTLAFQYKVSDDKSSSTSGTTTTSTSSSSSTSSTSSSGSSAK